jgi:hypothetical protein
MIGGGTLLSLPIQTPLLVKIPLQYFSAWATGESNEIASSSAVIEQYP